MFTLHVIVVSISYDAVEGTHCTFCHFLRIFSFRTTRGVPGSPYAAHMSSAILKLQETGTLQRLKNRWWKDDCSGEERESRDTTTDANALGISNVGGVFLVLLGGLGMSSFIAVLEFIWKKRPSHNKFASVSKTVTFSFYCLR